MTPPGQAEFLKHSLGDRIAVDLRLIPGAGHFSFMNTPPPQTSDLLVNRDDLLNSLAGESLRFIMNKV